MLININTILCFYKCQFLFVTYKNDRAMIVHRIEVVHVNSLKLFQSNQIHAIFKKEKKQRLAQVGAERIAEI